MTSRRGFTLIELLTSISIGSVLLGVAVATILTLMKSEQVARNEFRRQTTLARLAQQFRHDAHASVRLSGPKEADAKPVVWEFEASDGQRIEYKWEGESLSRAVRSGEEVRQRDSYQLLPREPVQVEMVGGSKPAVVSLRIVPSLGQGRVRPSPPIEIDALLGADGRFAAAPTDSQGKDKVER